MVCLRHICINTLHKEDDNDDDDDDDNINKKKKKNSHIFIISKTMGSVRTQGSSL
jgi:hypothetical protein